MAIPVSPTRAAGRAALAVTVGMLSFSGPVLAQELIAFDPDQIHQAENHLITSNPGTFTGPDVAPIIGADTFYNNGITGQNSSVANVEAGHVWGTLGGHETLGHVVNFQNDVGVQDTDGNAATPEFDRHATWVGHMIGGRAVPNNPQPWQPGIAPLTNLQSGAIATMWSGAPYALGFLLNVATFDQPYRTFFGQTDVINSSWGGVDPEGNGLFAATTDGLANTNTGTLFVASAGNAGPGPNTVGSPGSGYNNMTVGALQNVGNVYNTVANFSSRGPQDYSDPVTGLIAGVRAAVDIAAPGTTLTGAYYGGTTGGNSSLLGPPAGPPGGPSFYSPNLGGTSFSAPITAAGAALVYSASRNDPGLVGNANSRDARVVKAVLMNSADKIPGWNNGQALVGGVVQTTQSLDWASGAGALNLDAAYNQYITSATRDVAGLGGGVIGEDGWDYGQVAIGGTNQYLFSQPLLGGSDLTVTLDWFRERTSSVVGQFVDIAQANLELIVRDLVTNNVIAQSISQYNVVEHLNFLLPGTSQYALEVFFNGNTFGNISLEQYGLAWNGVFVADQVPEPATLLLALVGMLALLRRKHPNT